MKTIRIIMTTFLLFFSGCYYFTKKSEEYEYKINNSDLVLVNAKESTSFITDKAYSELRVPGKLFKVLYVVRKDSILSLKKMDFNGHNFICRFPLETMFSQKVMYRLATPDGYFLDPYAGVKIDEFGEFWSYLNIGQTTHEGSEYQRKSMTKHFILFSTTNCFRTKRAEILFLKDLEKLFALVKKTIKVKNNYRFKGKIKIFASKGLPYFVTIVGKRVFYQSVIPNKLDLLESIVVSLYGDGANVFLRKGLANYLKMELTKEEDAIFKAVSQMSRKNRLPSFDSLWKNTTLFLEKKNYQPQELVQAGGVLFDYLFGLYDKNKVMKFYKNGNLRMLHLKSIKDLGRSFIRYLNSDTREHKTLVKLKGWK